MDYCTDCERYRTTGPTGQCHECQQEDQERREAEEGLKARAWYPGA